MRTFVHPRWSDPIPLRQWNLAQSGPGLYVIGTIHDGSKPMGSSPDNDGKFAGFPSNFASRYIGRSVSEGRGIRSRLSCHWRGRGNRSVAKGLNEGVDYWYITVAGQGLSSCEAIYLHVPLGVSFPYNRRPEMTRYFRELEPYLPETVGTMLNRFDQPTMVP